MSVVFPNLNTLGTSISLGKMYSLVKPLYWNKRKQLLKGVFFKWEQNLKNSFSKVSVHVYFLHDFNGAKF